MGAAQTSLALAFFLLLFVSLSLFFSPITSLHPTGTRKGVPPLRRKAHNFSGARHWPFFPARPRKKKERGRRTGNPRPPKDDHSFGDVQLLGTSALKDSPFHERKGVGLPIGRRGDWGRLAREDGACVGIGRSPRGNPGPALTIARAHSYPSIFGRPVVCCATVSSDTARAPIRCRVLKRQFSLFVSLLTAPPCFFYRTPTHHHPPSPGHPFGIRSFLLCATFCNRR